MKIVNVCGYYCVYSSGDVLAVFDTKQAARDYVRGF